MVRQLEPLKRLLVTSPSNCHRVWAWDRHHGDDNPRALPAVELGVGILSRLRKHEHPPVDHSSMLPEEKGGWFITLCFIAVVSDWPLTFDQGGQSMVPWGERCSSWDSRGKAMNWVMLQHLCPQLCRYHTAELNQARRRAGVCCATARGWTNTPPSPLCTYNHVSPTDRELLHCQVPRGLQDQAAMQVGRDLMVQPCLERGQPRASCSGPASPMAEALRIWRLLPLLWALLQSSTVLVGKYFS